MRLFLIPLAPLLWAQGDARVEGTVVSAVTGSGIAGVTVELALRNAEQAAYHVATGASGEFRIDGVAEGEYSVSYRKDHFEPLEYTEPAPQLRVSARGTVRLRGELDPLATVRGRVLDHENRPAPRIAVDLLSGRGQIRMTVTTDAEGAFIVPDLHPGAYLLRANPNWTPLPAKSSSLQDWLKPAAEAAAKERTLLAPAYYPGVLSRAEASPILIRGGEDLSGCDIRLRFAPVYRLRGRLLDDRGDPLAHVPVKLKSADAPAMFLSFPPDAQVSSGSEGAFAFPTVSAGDWYLIAETRRGQTDLLGVTPIAVTRHDLEDVTIRMSAPFSLDVSLEGLPEPDSPRPFQVHLVAIDGPIEQEVYSVGPKDGKIRVRRVYPGRYKFAEPFRAGYFLDSIRLGVREVLGQEFELADGAPPIRVIYKPGGGRVTGTVENGGWATVVLMSQDPGRRDQWQVARCDAAGRFEAKNLRPGDYFAVALRHAGAMRDPAFVAGIDRHATRLHVDADGAASVELRPTPWPD